MPNCIYISILLLAMAPDTKYHSEEPMLESDRHSMLAREVQNHNVPKRYVMQLRNTSEDMQAIAWQSEQAVKTLQQRISTYHEEYTSSIKACVN